MFSAYFGYIFPIVIGAGFISVGFVFFRNGIRFRALILSIPGTLAMLVGLGLILWILMSSPPPQQRLTIFERIFHTPPQRIIKVTIRTRSLNPLVTKDLTVTDPESLRQIALALGHATESKSGGGTGRWDTGRDCVWHAPIELTTSDGTFYFRASVKTDGRGAWVSVGTEPNGFGWFLGTFRAEEFARVLEQVRDKAQRNAIEAQRSATLEHIFHTPPEQMIKVTIRASSLTPLVTNDLTITDQESLREIAFALSKASEAVNESPVGRSLSLPVWEAPIELTTSDGTFYFRAGVTDGKEGFVQVGTGHNGFGSQLGNFRADDFARVLERLVRKPSQR